MQADKKQISRLLKTARGQIDGVLNMIEQDRYCLEISAQVMAAQAILQKANREILKAHINGCVRHALVTGDESKIDEIALLMEKLI